MLLSNVSNFWQSLRPLSRKRCMLDQNEQPEVEDKQSHVHDHPLRQTASPSTCQLGTGATASYSLSNVYSLIATDQETDLRSQLCWR